MDSFVLTQASAGSGKTRALVVRYLSLLFLNQSSSKILALTFTNKAVQEMKHRIIDVIYNLDSHLDYVEQISEITSLSQEEILDKKDEVLRRFLSDASHIVTFDKFFNKILRLFCFYGDINIDFGVKDSIKQTKFLNYFLGIIEQREIQELIGISQELNIDIFSILDLFVLLFSKDNEISGLIDTSLVVDNDLEEKVLAQVELLKNIAHSNNISSASAKKAVDNIEVIEDVLSKGWIKKDSLSEYSYFKKIYTQEMDDIFANIKSLLCEYFNQKQNIFLSKLLVGYSSFKRAKTKYQRFYNELSFDDIVSIVYDILQNSIDTDFLYYRLDSHISHILIDELQDTSMREYKILQPLIEEVLSGNSTESFRTLFFVGDKKQSIYGFKGAKKELVEDIASIPQIKTQILDTNYRSSKSIVDFTNELFSKQYNDYVNQKCNSSNIGYVNIQTTDKDDIKKTFLNTLEQMLAKGCEPSDIAVLGFKNKDLLIVNDWIREKYPKIQIITDMSSKLIEYPKIKAIISLINYFYFGDEVYLYNFAHITSNTNIDKLKDEGRLLFDKYQNQDQDIHSLVLNIVLKYKLYDENMASFLEKVSAFRDMIDFVYNVLDMDGKIVSGSMSGIRLITIHKSKGLEFDNVILLDQIGGNYTGSSPLVFSYQGTKLDNVYLKIKNREFVDSHYKQYITKEEQKSKEDLINLLYVAITRAKNSIFLIQKNKSSKFAILALRDESMGEFEVSKKTDIFSQDNDEILDITLKQYGLQQDFLHKNNHQDKQMDTDSIKNIEYGNAMHYMFECLHYLDKSSIDTAFSLVQNKYGFNIGQKALENIKKTVLKSLENSEFQKLIENKNIKKELSFNYKQQIGIIDLFLEDDKNIYIIDYKTSSSDSLPNYIEQVSFYKQAIKELYKKPTIGYLFFVNEQKLIRV